MTRRDGHAAFEEMYRATYADLQRYCRRRLEDPDDVQDVLSEVYTTAWRRLDDVLVVDPPIAWLYGVAFRTIGNRYRGRRRGRQLVTRLRTARPATDADPAEGSLDRAAVRAVRGGLDGLAPVDREIVLLAAWEGLSYDDIAAATGLTAGSVRSRLFRARRDLATHLEEATRDDAGLVDTDVQDVDGARADRQDRRPPRP